MLMESWLLQLHTSAETEKTLQQNPRVDSKPHCVWFIFYQNSFKPRQIVQLHRSRILGWYVIFRKKCFYMLSLAFVLDCSFSGAFFFNLLFQICKNNLMGFHYIVVLKSIHPFCIYFSSINQNLTWESIFPDRCFSFSWSSCTWSWSWCCC